MNAAPDRDKIAEEFYRHPQVRLDILPGTYTRLIKVNQIPDAARRYRILPFDNVGKDPRLRDITVEPTFETTSTNHSSEINELPGANPGG